MSKGLEALERIKPYADSSIDADLEIIEKELKALEILRNKPFVSMHDIQHYDNVIELNAYLKYMYGYKTTSVLTQEEYDLLKEVLL